MTKLGGYMNEVEWDGQTLRAKGTNKAAHRALLGWNDIDANEYVTEPDRPTEKWGISKDTAAGLAQNVKGNLSGFRQAMRDARDIPDELVLDRGEFQVEKFKPATRLVNGHLVLRDLDGRKYELHFRRKSNDDFTALAADLGASV